MNTTTPARLLTVTLTAISAAVLLLAPGVHVNAQDRDESLLYSQDFEEQSAPGWKLQPPWEIVPVDSGYALSGAQHTWANLETGYWRDLRFKFRIKPSPGSIVHVNLRVSHPARYFIGMGTGAMYLARQSPSGEFQEGLKTGPTLPAGWSDVEISLYGPDLTVSVNNQVAFTYTDPDPLETGRVAFESISEAATLIDDIEIWGEPAEAVAEVPTGLAWVRTGGPLGGLGYDVRMVPDNPDILFVSDGYAGVFSSRDGGETWEPSNEGITFRSGHSQDSIPIFCLTIDPHNHDIIWVGTEHGARIYKSTDGGTTWTEKTNNIRDDFFDGLTFRGFTIHPETSDVVYTAAELHSWANGREPHQGREFEMVEGIVYRTENGGETWNQVWRGDNLARYIWINPHNTDVIYISTGIFDREAANSDPEAGLPGGEGVLKSTDGGETWEHANNGLNNLYVGSLYMHPENPDILLAGTGNNQYHRNNGVYLTTDGGQTWQHVLQEENIESVEFYEPDPSIAYAASDVVVYRSEDGGETWKAVSQGEWGPDGVRVGFPIDFQVDPRNPDRLFANAYGGGNFLSEDGGHTWIPSSKGYTGAQVRAVTVHPEYPGVVYTAARSGLFVSRNGGEDWVGLNFQPAKAMEWNAVAVNPVDTLQLAAGNNWNGDLLNSYEGGLSWDHSGSRITSDLSGISAITFAPSDPNTMYAAAAGFYSAGTFDQWMPGTGIHISHDRGQTWTPVNTPLTEQAAVFDLLVDPHNPLHVFAASTNSGLLVTQDGGENWTRIENGLPAANSFSIALHPDQPDTLLAGFTRAGVYASTNGGNSWRKSSSGMPPEASITSIIFNPQEPAVAFASDINSGVYQSTNTGETWAVVNNGLDNRAVNDLAFSMDGMHLYAATEGGGVFRLDIAGQPPGEEHTFMPSLFEDSAVLEENEPGETSMEDMDEQFDEPEQLESAPESEPAAPSGLCSGVIVLPLAAGVVLFSRRKDSRRMF